MSAPQNVSRRGFLRASAAAAGGVLIGFQLGSQESSPAASSKLNAFVHVGKDDIVTLFIHKAEMGQGTVTSLSMLLAEELECDWKKIRTEFAGVNREYGAMQGVFGSASVRSSFDSLRRAGAAAREMLVQAAAQVWHVDPSVCRAENSAVINTATADWMTYGSLAEAASKLAAPANPPLKDPAQFRLVGKPVKRLDTPPKVDGSAQFGIDVRLPGMVYAVVARCPVFGGKVKSFDAARAKAVPGVKLVVQISSGVAVVADNTWSAMQGRRVLDVQWDEGPVAAMSTPALTKIFQDRMQQPGAEARKEGDAPAALAAAARKIEADYEVPFLAHAPMEPLNCTADVSGDRCTVWASTQGQSAARAIAARITGLPPEKVEVHTLYMGGGFGRRAAADYIGEAVEVSKAASAPVKLTWSREDDLQQDLYRPASYTRFAGALDADGWPLALTSRIACPPFGGVRNGLSRTARRGCRRSAVRDSAHAGGLSRRGGGNSGELLALRGLLAEYLLRGELPGRNGGGGRQGSGGGAPASAGEIAAHARCAGTGGRQVRLGQAAGRGTRARSFAGQQHRQFHRAGGGGFGRRRQTQGASRGLRGGLRPRREPGDSGAADSERHRVRAGGGAQGRHHYRSRPRAAEQFPSIRCAAYR